MNPDPKPPKREKKPRVPLKRKPIKIKHKATGELRLMLQLYNERGRKCEVTGQKIEFTPSCAMHILGKGTRPDLRLYAPNIIIVIPYLHYCYDNMSKEFTLKKFPNAAYIYDLKNKLKEIRNEKSA